MMSDRGATVCTHKVTCSNAGRNLERSVRDGSVRTVRLARVSGGAPRAPPRPWSELVRVEATADEARAVLLGSLIGRALNSFELPDGTIARLDCALAHDGSLHSAHHSAGLHRETYRHTWLLADGSALTLWELVHNTAPGREPQHEVY